MFKESADPDSRLIMLHDIFESKKAIYLLMDKLKGPNLMSYHTFGLSIKEKELRKILKQSLDILQQLKNLDILHTDIRPESLI